MIRAIVNYFSFLFAGILLLIGAAVVILWPARFWLDVQSIRVFDARFGDPVVMVVDRTINRNFSGHWVVAIRKWGAGGWVPFCSARGDTSYETDSVFPEPLTLRWWSYPDCHPLPPGRYTMRTSWTIEPTGVLAFMPLKSVSAPSNIFEIKP